MNNYYYVCYSRRLLATFGPLFAALGQTTRAAQDHPQRSLDQPKTANGGSKTTSRGSPGSRPGRHLREFTGTPDLRKGSRACARDGTGDGVGTRKVECQGGPCARRAYIYIYIYVYNILLRARVPPPSFSPRAGTRSPSQKHSKYMSQILFRSVQQGSKK